MCSSLSKNILLFIVFVFSINLIEAQELLLPLEQNPVKSNHKSRNPLQKAKVAADTLILPFFDDFSHLGPFPDGQLWADSFVFINTSFGYHSKTVGVATFDALDKEGKVYEASLTNSYQFIADHLTSLPIRLDSVFHIGEPAKLVPADSVMLSFYYQPQGKGIAPISRDSLVVQFYLGDSEKSFYDDEDGDDENDDELNWVTVWSAEGETLDTFSEGGFPYFKRVVIPVEDEVFFRKDFKFRFRNYASFPATKTPVNYAGNTSIWNIDYIYLNSGRSVSDIFYYDIAFVEPAQSILKDYTAMPWTHYVINPQNYLRSNFDVVFSNLDEITYNYSYRYFITDENGNLIRNYSGGTWNIAPFSQSGYQDFPAHTNPVVIPNPFPVDSSDERTFYIKHVIREGASGDEFQRNDTITYMQEFSKFYAYDDGVPEAGYGLSGWSPQGAYRFVIPKEDVLSSVSFFFNSTLAEQNQKPFTLKVWKSLEPEILLYESEVFIPEFKDGSFVFIDYPLNEAVFVTDTFYVGWSQLTSDFINIGFDVNNDAGKHIFFNVDGVWQESMFSGALMIRPSFDYTLSDNTIAQALKDELVLYPNPVKSSFLYLKTSNEIDSGAIIQVFDLSGRIIIEERFSERLNVGALNQGTYILRLLNTKQPYNSVRFIVLPR